MQAEEEAEKDWHDTRALPASIAYVTAGLCYGSGSISGLPSMTVNPGNALGNEIAEDLSAQRILLHQIRRMFEHAWDKDLPTDFN